MGNRETGNQELFCTGCGYTSQQHLPSMHEDLGSIPSTANHKRNDFAMSSLGHWKDSGAINREEGKWHSRNRCHFEDCVSLWLFEFQDGRLTALTTLFLNRHNREPLPSTTGNKP